MQTEQNKSDNSGDGRDETIYLYNNIVHRNNNNRQFIAAIFYHDNYHHRNNRPQCFLDFTVNQRWQKYSHSVLK